MAKLTLTTVKISYSTMLNLTLYLKYNRQSYEWAPEINANRNCYNLYLTSK